MTTHQELIELHDKAVAEAISVALQNKGDRHLPSRDTLVSALEAMGAEVERLKNENSANMATCKGIVQGLTAERDQLRAQLAARADGTPASKVERDLRRMLCAQRHGILAYMEDGEASWGGGDNHRQIDYMRESPEAIQQAWRDADLRQLAAGTDAERQEQAYAQAWSIYSNLKHLEGDHSSFKRAADSLWTSGFSHGFQHGKATHPAPAAPMVDAERYQWLTADHADRSVRDEVDRIASRISVRGKGATDAAIDAALHPTQPKGEKS